MSGYLANRASNAGSHFFDRATMRFFDSRLVESSVTWIDDDIAMFVTSERFESMTGEREPRKYTIRVAEFYRETREDGFTHELADVDTAHGHAFMEFNTLDSAMRRMRKDIAA